MPDSAGSLTGSGFLSPEKIDGVLSLIGGFCLHLTLGTLYCFGNLNTYMTSYLRKYVHPGIEYSDMIWIPCLATISQGTFMTYSGHLEELIGIRWTIITGATIMSAGVLLTSISIRVCIVYFHEFFFFFINMNYFFLILVLSCSHSDYLRYNDGPWNGLSLYSTPWCGHEMVPQVQRLS